MSLLTTTEAAKYLRLKERKLYELVAEKAVPCTKVTGRWLFPKAELDHWIMASTARPFGLAPPEPPPIVGGSHDPMLEWALRESGGGLATLPEGSERGLERFQAGEVTAAAIHLHDLQRADLDANVAAMRSRPHLHEAVLIGFIRRRQGLVVATGNPRRLGSLADIAASGARLALRPPGAGAQLLLLALLHHAGIDLRQIVVGPVCPTGPDIAQAIRGGHADCGVATQAVANAAALDFVALAWESFDLAVRQRDYFRPPWQALMRVIRSQAFAARAAELGGYDLAECGAIRWAP
ncbi:MAG: helix-turn-helix transcriptional regulator [Proteobacteria bacterium]|nr:helix-turn-helix transcriptional regulator [Pseudomonadota bacterium]